MEYEGEVEDRQAVLDKLYSRNHRAGNYMNQTCMLPVSSLMWVLGIPGEYPRDRGKDSRGVW